MKDWNFAGSRWWKFDFHTHTPESEDYGKGPRQRELKEINPKEWLLNFMKAKVDCVAVTDHNSGAWIDLLKVALSVLETEKPDDFRPLYLFPGVEISVHGGIHLLAIFGPDKTTSDIDSLLGKAEFEGTKGKSDDVTKRSFPEVVKIISEAGGLAIPAHVDDLNGLFHPNFSRGTTLAQSLKAEYVIAMESIHINPQIPSQYSQLGLNWTKVLGSDSHHREGIPGERYSGSHYTWIKMGTPSLEGLRLALLDGDLSVKRSIQCSENPNDQHASLVIESIVINKAYYIGKPDPFQITFNPWLNTIIGGRGTGKSTILEFLRLVLRRENELPESITDEFRKYFRSNSSRGDNGLLTAESLLKIQYRKDNSRYLVQWNQSGEAEPIQVETEDNTWQKEPGDIKQRFPVRIYSQKQIFEMAKQPIALLREIDRAIGDEKQSLVERMKKEEVKYLRLQAKIREIEAGLADVSTYRGNLEDVQKSLKVFEEARHADILREYQKRTRQKKIVEDWETTWANHGQRLRDMGKDLIPDEIDETTLGADGAEEKDLCSKASVYRKKIEKISENLNELSKEFDTIISEWMQERDNSEWRRRCKLAEQNYAELVKKLRSKDAGDPAKYGELVQRRQELESKLKDIVSRREQITAIARESEERLNSLAEIRRELTRLREKFLNEILADNSFIKIEVVPFGEINSAEIDIRRLLQCEEGSFKGDFDNISEKIRDGLKKQISIKDILKQIKKELFQISIGNPDNIKLADKRFGDRLSGLTPETFDRLQLWFPEDSLKVEYSSGKNGKEFRPINEGSPGQKTAALLAFLLSYGNEPLILDQPEDDLDNELIYSMIVAQLREKKQYRQVIVVTHNANIVVNGDAEQVIALEVRNGQTHKKSEGCLQDIKVRATICDIMEGGKDAFNQRYRRITLEKNRV